MSQVEIFENERAAGYNRFAEAWIPNYHYFLDILPKMLCETGTKTLLSAGCGTGNEIESFVTAPENWEITGVDPSPDMIRQAQEKFSNNQRVRLFKGALSDLETGDQYGAATLLLVLHFLKDDGNKLDLLEQIAERLMPGATFILLDITGDTREIRENLQILRQILPQNINEDEKNFRLNRIENEMHAVPETRLADLLNQAGFEKPTRFFQSAIYAGWLTRKR